MTGTTYRVFQAHVAATDALVDLENAREGIRMNCPKDGHTLEFIYGDYGTGVFAPDGVQEICYEEGWQCPKCGTVYDESDVSENDEL